MALGSIMSCRVAISSAKPCLDPGTQTEFSTVFRPVFRWRVFTSRASDVKPITYLKSRTADLVREVHEGGRAVTITRNGEAEAVIMDVALYDRWRSPLARDLGARRGP
jgi:prevent-host-death family protein